jgi:hypothetical protein
MSSTLTIPADVVPDVRDGLPSSVGDLQIRLTGLDRAAGRRHDGTIDLSMSAAGTTAVEIDNELLERLRQRSPGKSDRETLERVARIQLGFETIRRVQERNAAAGVDDEEVMAEAVRAVRESRAARRAAG